MHQIRRHMKHISHPVIGDTQHGDSLHNRYFREEFGCFRMLLHARRLSLLHPVTQAPLVITAPVAPDMLSVLDQLGWGGVVAGD
jgi:tRNA pseudouridine65 synthase